MYKIPTLFERDEKTHKIIPSWNLEVDSLLFEPAEATEKIDGTAVLIHAGRLYARQTLALDDTVPSGWVAAGPPVGEQRPGWMPCRRGDPQHKWHWDAWDRGAGGPATPRADFTWLPDGTYELVGPKVQANAYGLERHQLWKHGETKVYLPQLSGNAAEAFGYLKEFLLHAPIEGLVWWAQGKAIAKIKARDYGIPWPRARTPQPIASASTDA